MGIERTVRGSASAALLLFLLIMASAILPFHIPAASAFSFYTAVNLSSSADDESINQKVAASGSDVYVVWQGDTDSPGIYDIYFSKSADSGITFDSAVNLSSNGGFSTEPLIAASGSNVYVVWHDDTDTGITDVLFMKSADSGGSFETAVNLSNSAADLTTSVRMAISSSNVYVVWEQGSDIYFSASNDDGDSFSAPVNLSNTGNALNPGVAASGDNVYVSWSESDDVWVRGSADGGGVFASAVNVSGSTQSSSAQMTASGDNVYVVWSDSLTSSGFSDIFFSKSTDNGANFSAGIPVSETDGTSLSPNIVVADGNIYVAWQDEDTSFVPDVLFARSTDDGDSFDSAVSISDNAGSSSSQQLAASGSDVYVVWEDDTDNPGFPDIFFLGSTDSGVTFGTSINVSDSDPSQSARIAASGSMLYITWLDISSGIFPDVFVRAMEDTGPPAIEIVNVSNESPKWDIDTVQVSGTANADNIDTITIDWGDGESTPNVAIVAGTWGPESHEYDSANTGEKEIVARLINQFDVERIASDPQIVDVQKHETTLTLNSIFSVVEGSDINAEGTLVDADTSDPLDGMTVTFTGAGAINLLDALTATGAYSSTGAAPDVGTLLEVTASFAGDDAYEVSTSSVYFDAVEPDTAEFDVPSGTSQTVELTGFDASILFDDVESDGSVFVSSCESPASGRYEELTAALCLKISPAVTLATDSSAHITISYAGHDVPAGYSTDDIDIFHESSSGIVDITESRDTDAETVTGSTTDFSRFIVGTAVHVEAPEGGSRQQLYVGTNNLVFDFTETKEIEFEDNTLRKGDVAELSVTDPSLNTDSSAAETLEATVVSSSDPTGITVELTETGPDTGVFEGSFTLSGTDSSDEDEELLVDKGDTITASYEEYTKATFELIIDGVVEAGVIDLADYDAPSNALQVGDGYGLSLVDAVLADDVEITVIMSYANADLFDGDEPEDMRILRMDGIECRDEITLNSSNVDLDEMTVTGTTDRIDDYIISLAAPSAPGDCPPGIGGSGGGLPRPGSGLVLDAVATVLSSGGGGSSGTKLVASNPVGSDNIETDIRVGSETVSVTFESMTGGVLEVDGQEPLEVADLFSEVEDNQGHGLVDGSQFTTAGSVFEIDASNVDYEGSIEITIPYDESLVSNEEDVRFLHYGEDGWEDATVEIDTEDNTVTGQVTSLSPVVAATVNDGTYGDAYFVAHPTKRMAVMDAQMADVLGDLALTSTSQTPSQTSLQAAIKNSQRTNQTYAFIIQVLDGNGFTQSISWQTGELGMGESTIVSSSWAGDAGTYKVRMFVWTDISAPVALSEVATRDVVVA